jgi:thioredoxin reductase
MQTLQYSTLLTMKKITIIGSGFAGLTAARVLRRAWFFWITRKTNGDIATIHDFYSVAYFFYSA